jgi:hypothetical protein
VPSGKEFPTEDDKEQVVFMSFFERKFSVPTGDFFRVSYTTTRWSWYASFPTPSLQYPPSSISVKHTWGYHHTSSCGGIFSTLRRPASSVASYAPLCSTYD